MKFPHQQFLHQLHINITVSVVTVGRIIDEMSNTLYSPFGDRRVQNTSVHVTVKERLPLMRVQG